MTTTDSLRAALRDLMDDVDQYSINRDVWERARAALAQPDPALSQRPECFEFALDFLGSPENDQLREYIEQLEARAALAQPEPEVVGLSDNQLDLVVIAIQALTPHQPDATTHDLHVVDRGREILRRSLARWCRSAQAPAGEVAELVAELRRICFDVAPSDADTITRAADLLERQAAPVPRPVSERLPEPSVKVLAHYFNVLGKGRTICAIWVPAKTRSDSYGDDDFTEYDEESDTFYWPEGWYETIENWDDLGYVKVDEGEVIYWQPLPKWPANALPLPAEEVQP